MSTLSQDGRLLRITTPAGKDVFRLVELRGQESISALYQFELELVSEDHEITPETLLGKVVSASIHYHTEHTRYIHGHVSQFQAGAVLDGLRSYSLIVVPGAWFMSLNEKSAIYTEQTSADIIWGLQGEYEGAFSYQHAQPGDIRSYCIQYQESDFEFFSRLLAEEGLSYYFTQDESEHGMVVAESHSRYGDCAETDIEHVAAAATGLGQVGQLSRITSWQREYKLHTGNVAMTGYLESDAGKGQNVSVATRNKRLKSISKYKRSIHDSAVPYKYTEGLAEYGDAFSQKKTAELILEAEEASFDIAHGESNCCSFFAGGRFTLKHDLASESGQYLLTRVGHYAVDNGVDTYYSNEFVAIPSTSGAHPHPSPPFNRLRINGPQLATVTEVKAGDSPGDGDPQLMVKVHFYWDENENSCWVRVMQNYAGKRQGAVFVPRVDSEVVLEFIGGDPDRPLVYGAVYNSDNVAPQYSKTQSGFQTASNEFRFDDVEGEEEIYLKAGKDLNYLVMNDEAGEIHNDQKLDVGNDQTQTIGNNQDIFISNNCVLEAGTSITLKVGANKIVIDAGGITMKGMAIKGTADTNVELKGNIAAKLEGGATAEVKAGGVLTVKGGVTMIN
ncbi:hypothetical protein A9Q89_04430 [Gammaproteobacteria bacterium 53_120_T64]|nr:hypothetical protein A9Q89_04430 [Gammaproteobacteria bacterium 53_120_T64]